MRLLKSLTGFLALLAILPVAGFADEAAKKPNILLIVGDDISYGDLGFAGSVTRTPNLDRLAKDGMMFTNFHASPASSVTRGMLLTGNTSHDIGLGAPDNAVYPDAKGKPGYESYVTRGTTAMISELLKDAGYRTYMTGKWHLGGGIRGGEGPEDWGFDRSYNILTGAANHWNQEVFHVDINDPEQKSMLRQGKIPHEPYFEDGKRVIRPIGIFSDDLWSSKMVQFIESERKTQKPFFAYLAFTTPHAPIQAPYALIDKYYDYYLETGYAGLKKSRYEAQKKYGLIPENAPYAGDIENELLTQWKDVPEERKKLEARIMATYSAMMESQDFNIGKVLNYLNETRQLNNTLIIYMSDNGPEGSSDIGQLGNPDTSGIIQKKFSQDFDEVGSGRVFGFIGSEWANAVTGGLQWWKWFIGEGGIRVPLIIVPPKDSGFTSKGKLSHEYLSVMDIPMTILDYAGVQRPENIYKERAIKQVSGVSVRDYIEGKRDKPRTEEQWVAFELFGNKYIFAGDYKAIKVRTGMYGDGQWHLYNTKRDPGEVRDIGPANPNRLNRMIAYFDQYAREKGIVDVRDDWSPWHGLAENSDKQ
jgi:arylsulfatase A-like enzyme